MVHRPCFRTPPGRRRVLVRALTVLSALPLLLSGPESTGAAAEGSGAPVLLVLGDSISAEYGLPRDTGWVRLLDARLREQRYRYEVVNASISGETTSGGAARIDELLRRLRPRIVIVELGGNDGLRGLQLPATQQNLETIVTHSQKAGAAVLLVGMQLPPNYGRAYVDRFAALFPALSKKYRTALVPFLFDGFADRFELFQPDRIHPTQAAQPRLLDNVWPALAPLLRR